MTRAEIELRSDEAGRRITPQSLSTAPLSGLQRARITELRWQAAEYSRRKQVRQADARPAREQRAVSAR